MAQKKLYSVVGQRQPRIVADGQSIKGDDGDGVLVILSDHVCVAERIQSDGVQIRGAGGEIADIQRGDVALRVVYGMDAPESPRALGKYTQGDTLVVTLSAPVLRRETGELLLEIAGEDGAYHPVQSVTLAVAEMRLRSVAVLHPTKVRYAYVNWGKVSLFGRNGLPLAPFAFEG